ncbi:MAG: NUDIX hydrolase [Micromonosporaceae bacterium]
MIERDWQCLAQRPGYDGHLRVVVRTYRLPSGATAEWDIVLGGPTVAVLAVTDDERFVLASQYRPGPGRVLLELPGGCVEADEDPLAAAARELREETGFAAATLTLVGRTWLGARAAIERYAVLAQGCHPVGPPAPEPEEFCETVLLDRAALLAHLRTGDLTDLDVAYMCLDRLRNGLTASPA